MQGNWIGAAAGHGFGRLWAFRWLFGVPVAIGILAATLFAVSRADFYEAVGTIRIREFGGRRSQQLPVEQQIKTKALMATMHDRLFSSQPRAAAALVLWPGADVNDVKVLEAVRRQFRFEKESDISFEVGCVHADPEVAASAVNTLFYAFNDEAAERLIATDREVLKYLHDRVLEAEDDSTRGAKQVLKFEEDNVDHLPQQKDSLNSKLNRYDNMIALLTQKSEWERRRIEELRAGAHAPSRGGVRGGRPGSAAEARLHLKRQLTAEEAELESAERELARRRETFADGSLPVQRQLEVVARWQRAVDQTREDLAALTPVAKDDADGSSSPDEAPLDEDEPPDADDPLDEYFAEELKRSENAFECCRGDLEKLERERAAIQVMRDKVPMTEWDYAKVLDRLKASEEGLAEARKAEAAYDKEARWRRNRDAKDVTQYELARPAVAPLAPAGPNRLRYLLTGVGAGLALGYGLFVLRKRFHRAAVSTPEDLLDLVRGAMIVTVPQLPAGEVRSKRFRPPGRELALTSVVLVCLLLSAYLWAGHAELVAMPDWLSDALGKSA